MSPVRGMWAFYLEKELQGNKVWWIYNIISYYQTALLKRLWRKICLKPCLGQNIFVCYNTKPPHEKKYLSSTKRERKCSHSGEINMCGSESVN